MVRFLVATADIDASDRICDYLTPRVTASDTVYAVNSLPGRTVDAFPDDVEPNIVESGENALGVIERRLEDITTVETHQLIRGNKPAEDLLIFADEHRIDEIVIGIRQRSATTRFIFGSTAQRVLREATRPVVAIPLAP